jgi:hypothetical protein
MFSQGSMPDHGSAVLYAGEHLLNELTRRHTAFKSFRDLVEAKGGYRPTLLISIHNNTQLSVLAFAYDQTQIYRGDSRRVNRG